MFSITCFREYSNFSYTGSVDLVLMQNKFFSYPNRATKNNFMAIDQNKINSILATTDNFSNSVISTLHEPVHVTYSAILVTHLSDFPMPSGLCILHHFVFSGHTFLHPRAYKENPKWRLTNFEISKYNQNYLTTTLKHHQTSFQPSYLAIE